MGGLRMLCAGCRKPRSPLKEEDDLGNLKLDETAVTAQFVEEDEAELAEEEAELVVDQVQPDADSKEQLGTKVATLTFEDATCAQETSSQALPPFPPHMPGGAMVRAVFEKEGPLGLIMGLRGAKDEQKVVIKQESEESAAAGVEV